MVATTSVIIVVIATATVFVLGSAVAAVVAATEVLPCRLPGRAEEGLSQNRWYPGQYLN
jgi:hypothetical protein